MTKYKYRILQENLIIGAILLIATSAAVSIGYSLIESSVCNSSYEYPLIACK